MRQVRQHTHVLAPTIEHEQERIDDRVTVRHGPLPAVGELGFDARDGVDVAVRYGPGVWPGLQAEPLMQEEVFPVASPRYRGGRLPRKLADLARCTLLRHTSQPWEPWFQAAGLDMTEPRDGPVIDNTEALLAAAIDGEGIALARRSFVQADLAAGRLVRLWRRSFTDIYAYFIVWRADSAKLAAIDALRDWLHSEAEAAQQ